MKQESTLRELQEEEKNLQEEQERLRQERLEQIRLQEQQERVRQEESIIQDIVRRRGEEAIREQQRVTDEQLRIQQREERILTYHESRREQARVRQEKEGQKFLAFILVFFACIIFGIIFLSLKIYWNLKTTDSDSE